MSKSSLEDQLIDFYQNESLSEDRLDSILEVRKLSNESRKWKQVAIAASLALAVVLMFTIGLLLQETGNSNENITNQKSEDPKPDNPLPSPIPTPDPDQSIVEPQYRFVAFRSHSDVCPHCKETGEVFRQLVHELSDQPLEFEQFDLSQTSNQSATQQRLEELHLTPLIKDRIETAFLAIVDKSGTKIKEYKPSMQPTQIAASVRKLVSK